MEIKIFANAQEASKQAFNIFKEQLESGAEVFGLATGSTPEALYALLADSDLDFSNAVSVNLDEYVGLDNDHPQSYHYFMHDHLFQFKPFKQTFVPDGANLDADSAIKAYDEILVTYPRDVQLLGLGPNGHIGFDEPGTDFDATMLKVSLTESTIEANKRFFDDVKDVPTEAYTMGPKAIMDAKTVVLMAFGKGKAEAVKSMIEGPVTEASPASILQNHANAIILIDEDAASLLSEQTKTAAK